MNSRHEDGLGGSITILEQGSTTAPMRFRMILPKGLSPPAPECHPSQAEDFRVLRGVLDLGVIDGKRLLLKAGETYHLPAGVYHQPACAEGTEVEIEATLTPGLESGAMFAALYTAVRNHRGLGQFVRVSMVMRRYVRVIAFRASVRAVMRVVAALGSFFGVEALTAPSADPREDLQPHG